MSVIVMSFGGGLPLPSSQRCLPRQYLDPALLFLTAMTRITSDCGAVRGSSEHQTTRITSDCGWEPQVTVLRMISANPAALHNSLLLQLR